MMRTRRPISLRRRLAWRPKAEILEDRRLLSGDIIDLVPAIPKAYEYKFVPDMVILNFVSTRATPRAADFSASIAWDDGTTSAGTVVPGPIGPDGEVFSVWASHSYAGQIQSLEQTTTVEDAEGAASATTVIFIHGDNPYGLQSIPVPRLQILPDVSYPSLLIDEVVGQPGGLDWPPELTSTVAWGDGTTGDGILSEITPGPPSVFAIYGLQDDNYPYQAPGDYSPFSTAYFGNGTSGVVGNIEVGALFATGESFSEPTAVATDAAPALAFFTVASDAPATGLTATIAWGDGTTTLGIVTPGAPAGSGVPTGASPFTVSGSHAYAKAGNYVPRIVVRNAAGDAAVAEAKATIADESLTPSPQSIVAKVGGVAAGGAAANGLVGFGGFSTTDPDATAADFAATIDWGDGTSSAGVIEQPAGSATSSAFEVEGSHSYAQNISYPVRISVTSVRGASATIPSVVNVLPAVGPGPYGDLSPIPTSPTAHVDSAPGLPVDGKALDTFTVENPGPLDSISNYAATIDWGDGSSGTGSIALVGSYTAGGFEFAVSGDHTYASAGNYAMAITLEHVSGDATTSLLGGPVLGVASVVPEAIAVLPDALGGFPGSPVLGYTPSEVANFTDAAPGLEAGDYTASIDWGDGSTTSGTIVAYSFPLPAPDPNLIDSLPPTIPNVGFHVYGNHIYAKSGEYVVIVTIRSAAGVVGSSTGNAEVGPIFGLGDPSIGFTNRPDYGFELAGLNTRNPSADPSDFQVGIVWGDGTSSSGVARVVSSVSIDGSAPQSAYFEITGDHTYTASGTYHPIVYVIDPAGDLAKSVATVTVFDEALTPRPNLFYGIAGAANTDQLLGRFTSSSGPANPSDYLAAIDWGDGTTTLGQVSSTPIAPNSQVVLGSRPSFDVTGSHAYATPGLYVIRVTVVSTSESATRFNSGVEILPTPEAIGASPIAAQATAGEDSLSGIAVATFTDSDPAITDPGSFVAAIDWGDGSAPTGGTVQVDPGASGTFLVSGDHVYEDPGLHFLRITILRVGGASTVLKGGVDVLSAPPAPPQPTPVPPPPSPQILTGMPAASPIEATANAPATLIGLASIRDSDPLVGAGLIAASIDWADGSAPTPGEVVATADGFQILGGHSYAKAGTFVVRISVTTQATAATYGSSTIIADEAIVAPAPAPQHPARVKAVRKR